MTEKLRKGSFMNVEIAQRLASMRREKGYSQEELAARLGLSRQAVSKWERAESSPDTGNLVALAKLYGVTVDELLRVEEDIEDDVRFEECDRDAVDTGATKEAQIQAQEAAVRANEAAVRAAQAAVAAAQARATAEQAHAPAPVGQPASVAPGQQPAPAPAPVGQSAPAASAQQPAPSAASVPSAVHMQQPVVPQPRQTWSPQESDAARHGEDGRRRGRGPWTTFPYPILCVIVFLALGFFCGAWHPGWLVFLTIPLYYWIAHIIENDPNYRAGRR